MGMNCSHCRTEHHEIPIRICDRKLLSSEERAYIDEYNYLRYCNAYYEAALDIWLCRSCGEVHEYNKTPRICSYIEQEKRCKGSIIWEKSVEHIVTDDVCKHCGTIGMANPPICKVQDRTKCECDGCMTLYSKFRNNKTKSARK
jgi:hypothetical protein